jgi:thioredoxin-related protein
MEWFLSKEKVRMTTFDKNAKQRVMQKVILITVLAFFGLAGLVAQETVKWYSIEEAVRLSNQEPRVLVIDVYTDWCGWCKRMDAMTFSDPEIAAMLNKNFYPVKLNAEGKEDIVIGDRTFKFVDNGGRGYHEIAAVVTRGRLSYPTISYVDEQGRVLQAAPGFKTPDQLKIYLTYYAEGIYKNQDFESYMAGFAGQF